WKMPWQDSTTQILALAKQAETLSPNERQAVFDELVTVAIRENSSEALHELMERTLARLDGQYPPGDFAASIDKLLQAIDPANIRDYLWLKTWIKLLPFATPDVRAQLGQQLGTCIRQAADPAAAPGQAGSISAVFRKRQRLVALMTNLEVLTAERAVILDA